MLHGRVQSVLVSLEAQKGTAVPGAAELRCYDPEIKRDDNVIQQENVANGRDGPEDALAGPSTGSSTLKTWLRSDGVSTLDAASLVLLQSCGLKHNAGVLSIATAFDDQKTVTIDRVVGGLGERLFAAAGNWKLSGEFGKPVELEFAHKGKYLWQGSVAQPAVSASARAPMRAENMTLTLGTIGPAGGLKVSKFALSANIEPELREDLSAGMGIGYYMIGSGWRYTIELDPEAMASADWDPMTIHEAGTVGALSLVLADADVTMTIAAPRLQILPMSLGSRGSKLIYEGWRGQLNPDAGGDDITVTLAAVV